MFRTLAKSASVPLHGVCGVEMSVEQVDGLQTLPLHTVSVRGRVQLLFGSQDRYPQLKFILAASSAHTHMLVKGSGLPSCFKSLNVDMMVKVSGAEVHDTWTRPDGRSPESALVSSFSMKELNLNLSSKRKP